MPSIREIVNFMNAKINPKLAYSWDNSGLQVGSSTWDVKKIFLTLDINEISVQQAINYDCNLIISHHPYIFHPIKSVTDSLTLNLIEHKIGVFSAHTNLDVIPGGVNSILADLFELENQKFIDTNIDAEYFYGAFYLPQSYFDKMSKIIHKNGGNIFHNIYEKSKNGDNIIKVEFSSDSFNINKIVGEIRNFHPNKNVEVSIFSQKNNNSNYGLGIQGNLKTPISLINFAKIVKQKTGNPKINLWLGEKNENDLIKNIAICGGTGASLLPKLRKNVDCFVTSDLTYHTILDSKIALIDAGHLYTEYPVLSFFEKILDQFEVEIYKSSLSEQKYSQKMRIL